MKAGFVRLARRDRSSGNSRLGIKHDFSPCASLRRRFARREIGGGQEAGRISESPRAAWDSASIRALGASPNAGWFASSGAGGTGARPAASRGVRQTKLTIAGVSLIELDPTAVRNVEPDLNRVAASAVDLPGADFAEIVPPILVRLTAIDQQNAPFVGDLNPRRLAERICGLSS